MKCRFQKAARGSGGAHEYRVMRGTIHVGVRVLQLTGNLIEVSRDLVRDACRQGRCPHRLIAALGFAQVRQPREQAHYRTQSPIIRIAERR